MILGRVPPTVAAAAASALRNQPPRIIRAASPGYAGRNRGWFWDCALASQMFSAFPARPRGISLKKQAESAI